MSIILPFRSDEPSLTLEAGDIVYTGHRLGIAHADHDGTVYLQYDNGVIVNLEDADTSTWQVLVAREPNPLIRKMQAATDEMNKNISSHMCPVDLYRLRMVAAQQHQMSMRDNVAEVANLTLFALAYIDTLAQYYVRNGYCVATEQDGQVGWTVLKPHLLTCNEDH